MKEFLTSSFNSESASELERLAVYNGLDCCLTMEVWQQTQGLKKPHHQKIYDFEFALQNPALDMMLKGIKINIVLRSKLIRENEIKLTRIQERIDALAEAVWDAPLNPNSPKQCCELLYETLGIPPHYPPGKRKSKAPSTDNKILEKIKKNYFYARPFCYLILEYREVAKILGTLKAKLSSAQRMHFAIKVAGTETGRFASSKSAFDEGTNIQNQTEYLKRMYVADPGMKLAYIDLEQAESRLVGLLVYALFGESEYLDACESEDLHTTVCRMVWPNLAWTGNIKEDRKQIADQIFFRHFTYRDMSKRGGHGTNYYGKPFNMARQLNVEQEIMEAFQLAYFEAFPGIRKWHEWTAKEIQTKSRLITPFGRERTFFGRTSDDSTLREAIADVPQSSIGDLLNLGMLKVWRRFPAKQVQLLAQVHDAILIQYPEKMEDEILPQVLALLPHPIRARDREVIIPCEAEVGWNWGKEDLKKKYWDDCNPDGLRSYEGHDNRSRTEFISAKQSLLSSLPTRGRFHY